MKMKCSLCDYKGVLGDYVQHMLDNHFEMWCERCLDAGLKLQFRGLLAWKVHHIHIHRSFMIENRCFSCEKTYTSGKAWRLHVLKEHMADNEPRRIMVSSRHTDFGNLLIKRMSHKAGCGVRKMGTAPRMDSIILTKRFSRKSGRVEQIVARQLEPYTTVCSLQRGPECECTNMSICDNCLKVSMD